jgi:hypothetical protein
MLKLNLNDKELFGNDAGEDEKQDILDSYFIDLEDFDDFYDISNTLSVVSARKGMGKSSLLSRLEYRLQNTAGDCPIIIRTTGNSLLGLGNFDKKDATFLENYWKQIICKKINIEIGKNIGLALSDSSISMVEAAELEGIKNKNIIGALLARIKGKIPGLGVETKTSIPANWEALLTTYKDKHKDGNIWLLIDDIDAKYLDNDEYQNRVGSFFSAIRSLSKDVNGLIIRTTVRTDVWCNLRHLEDLDKWEQYILEIKWTKRQLRNMLAKRIKSYVMRNYPNQPEAKFTIENDYEKLYELVFFSKIRWSGRDQPPFEPINVLANKRPRWMGQLCRMAGKQAHKGQVKIGYKQIDQVLEEFGKLRISDLVKEHKHQFAELVKLIDAFRAGNREYNYNDLIVRIYDKYVAVVKDEKVPSIDGTDYSSLKQLSEFLYRIGFISKSHGDGVHFTHFSDNPDLFETEENFANNIIWAVHPSYRAYLNIK